MLEFVNLGLTKAVLPGAQHTEDVHFDCFVGSVAGLTRDSHDSDPGRHGCELVL